MKAVRIGDSMAGSVGHHAGHIIGWTGGEHPQPIYCSGHAVNGQQQTGASKVYIEGRRAARKGDTGYTNCPCDGQGYTIQTGSHKVFIEDAPAARMSDILDIHSVGTGQFTSSSSKVYIG